MAKRSRVSQSIFDFAHKIVATLFHSAKPGFRLRFAGNVSRCGLLVLLLMARPAVLYAKSNVVEDFISVNTYYDTYAAITKAPNVTTSPAPSVDVEMTLRLETLFSLVIAFSQFLEPDPTNSEQMQAFMRGAGGGIRVDLPGFFLLFPQKSDSSRDGRLFPVNTFIFGQVVKVDSVDVATGQRSVIATSRYGAGMDIFTFNKVTFLTVRYSIFNHLGSMYGSPGFGMGFSF